MASELAYEASDEASENELLDKSLSVWKGWNPSVIDNEVFSPVKIDIYTASSIGQYESVRSLINKGEVDIDRRNKGGWTPLMYASYIGHDAITKLLIDAECDINIKNNNGQTPLMLAASCGNEGVGHILVKYEAELESLDKKGWTALFHATNSGHQNFVRFLLTSGTNMNAVVPFTGVTPLMEAAAEGHEIIVQLLLQFGVDVNAKTYNGDMARSVALINGYMKIVSLIDNHLMPLTNRRNGQADFSSSDEVVRRPRPQLAKGSKTKLRSGPSIRDGPEAIARLIDRSKLNNNTQHIPNSCVPKGYVTFPQMEGEQRNSTQLSYRDVTSPINPEDYILDSSVGKDSYENEDDSNAFSKTGAITIKSSSSSSGGLVAALGLSRDNSLESDDIHTTHGSINHGKHKVNHHRNTTIITHTPSSSCDEDIDDEKVELGCQNQTKQLEQYSNIKYCGIPTNRFNTRFQGNCEKRQETSRTRDTQLDPNLLSTFHKHLESKNVWKSQLDSLETKDSGISTNDAEDYGIASPHMKRISNVLPGNIGSIPQNLPVLNMTVNKHPSMLSHTIADQFNHSEFIQTEEVPNLQTNNFKIVSDEPGMPTLATGRFPGQQVIPPNYPQNLSSLLEKHGLSKYESLFEEQDVDLTVFLSLTDNDLKEIGIILFGPRKKMTNMIARWHSNAPVSFSYLERAYADRLEGEMQEMAIQLNQAYINVDKLKAQIQQEQQLRSVTESCLLDQQEAKQNIHHIVIDTRKQCDCMKEKIKKFKTSLNDLKENLVKNKMRDMNLKSNKITDRSSPDVLFNKMDKYLKELSQNVATLTMNCDHISDKCVNSREEDVTQSVLQNM